MNKILIIGGGPVGLYFANLCEKKKIDYVLLEAGEQLGGQISALYPEKEIVDLPGIPSIKAKDYVTKLVSTLDLRHIKLSEEAVQLIEKEKSILVKTKVAEYEAEYLIIASGLGFSKPRPMGLDGEDKCQNILYSLSDFTFLKGKKVAIFGGGDSALDWAKEVSKISDHVSLVHRRTEFRGNPDTIKDCKNLKVFLPYIPYSLSIEGKVCHSIDICKVNPDPEATKEIVSIPVDYILVNYGNIPAPLPFDLPKDGLFLKVDEKHQISKRIFAIGDVSNYEGKKRRIAPGNEEADAVFALIS